MPHPIEDGDNVGNQTCDVEPDSQSRSLCTGSDISRFGSVDSDKEGTSSHVHLVRHASMNTQNVDELNYSATWPGVMSRNVREYPGLFSPNRTACNHNRNFPRNESDRTRFSVLLQKITTIW